VECSAFNDTWLLRRSGEQHQRVSISHASNGDQSIIGLRGFEDQGNSLRSTAAANNDLAGSTTAEFGNYATDPARAAGLQGRHGRHGE
jgi:hypothetical protein